MADTRIRHEQITSESSDDDDVLTSDGAEGAAWEPPLAGGGIATDPIWDAKGDLAVGTGPDTAAKLTVGANGKYLKADNGEATGLIWDTPNGSGDVVGPAGATNNHVALFDGATGKLIKDGGAAGSGDVVGPAGATDSHLALFDGATGKLIKDGGAVPAGPYTQGAKVYSSADQALTQNAWTTIAFELEFWDTDAIHDNVTNNSRLTCKTTGVYLVTAHINAIGGYTSQRNVQIQFLVNGTPVGGASTLSAGTVAEYVGLNYSTLLSLTANQYVQVQIHPGDVSGMKVYGSWATYMINFGMHRVG